MLVAGHGHELAVHRLDLQADQEALAADIVERFYTFLWPMLRISALLVTAPLFSLDALTLPIRIMLALVVTIFVYPLIQWPVIDPVTANGILQIVNQLFIGAMMGLMLQVAIGAISLAGQTIAASMGLSMASMVDPNIGNVPVISQFLVIMSTLIFLGFGGHVIMISMIVKPRARRCRAGRLSTSRPSSGSSSWWRPASRRARWWSRGCCPGRSCR